MATALSAGIAGRLTGGLAKAGFTATGASVVGGTIVGGATGVTGAVFGDIGAKIAKSISGDKYVDQVQNSMMVGPLGWLEGGLTGAMLGGILGRLFGRGSRGPSDAYLDATRTARDAAGRTDIATTPPTAVAGETTGPVVYVNGEPVPPSHYGKVYHGDGLTPEQVRSNGGFKAAGDNWDLIAHTEETSARSGGRNDSALRGATTLVKDAAQWGDWVYEIEGVPVWDANKVLQGKVRVAGVGEFRGTLMHGEVEQSIPGEIPLKNITRFGQVIQFGKGSGVKVWYNWDTYPGAGPDPK